MCLWKNWYNEFNGTKKLLLILFIFLSGCGDPDCVQICRCPAIFDSCPCTFEECEEYSDDRSCDSFVWEEEGKRCITKGCLFCPVDQSLLVKEIIENNKLIVIERDPLTGNERETVWDLGINR